jgi:hypothetical protein
MKFARAFRIIVILAMSAALIAAIGWRWRVVSERETRDIAHEVLYHLLDGMTFDGLEPLRASAFENHNLKVYSLQIRLKPGDVAAIRERVIERFFADTRRNKNPKLSEFGVAEHPYSVSDAPWWWNPGPGSRYVLLECDSERVILSLPQSGADVLVHRTIWAN